MSRLLRLAGTKKLLFIVLPAVTASFVLTATPGAADSTVAYAPGAARAASLLSQESQQAVTIVNAFPTALDPTLGDTAVTDDDLATVGVQPEAAPTLADDPKNLVVDDDRVQCPKAQYTTINDAVLAASSGAHIKVCPGLYRESVQIDKPLLLHGERKNWATQRSARHRSPTIRLAKRFFSTPPLSMAAIRRLASR